MNDDHAFLDGFEPDTADQINRFIDSQEAILTLKSNKLWFFSPLFAGLGLVVLLFSGLQIWDGLKKLKQYLATL